MKKVLWALFVLYLAVLLHLLFARESMADGTDYWQQVLSHLNLEPLKTIRHQYRLLNMGEAWAVYSGVVNIYGNVIVFIPLGLGLPWGVGWLRRFWRTMLFGAACITLVELAQLLTLRGFGDVDDLLLNLLGVAMGYGLFRLFVHKKA